MSEFSLKNYPYRTYVAWSSRNWYSDNEAINSNNIDEIIEWLCDEVGSAYLKSGFFKDKLYKSRKSHIVNDDDESTWTARWPGSKSKKLIFYFKSKEDMLKFILTWT